MPTYEYECEACGHRFDLFQPMASDPIRTCPECRKRRVKRLIGAGAGIIFRGSGFYQTDYRSSEYKARAEADTTAAKGEKPSGGAAPGEGSAPPPAAGAEKSAPKGDAKSGGKSAGEGDAKRGAKRLAEGDSSAPRPARKRRP